MPKVGIDFGTTNSLAVAYDKKRHEFTYFNYAGDKPSPISSTIEFHDSQVIIGNQARKNMSRLEDVEGYHFERSIKAKIGSNQNVYVFGESKEPYEIAALIIENLKRQAINEGNAEQAHVDMHTAVFTIPINFSGKARQELRKAANRAGIEVATFIHEPFAAIVGYYFTKITSSADDVIQQLESVDSENILVFDFGGGTLDITAVQVKEGKMLEIGTAELTGEAGDKIDEKIARLVWNRFIELYENQYSLDYLEKKRKEKWGRLLAIAEQCKIALSSKDSYDFLLENVTGIDENIDEVITRANFEKLLVDMLDAACNKVDEALLTARLQPMDISRVLLTGGSCNIPAVQKRLQEKFGHRVERVQDADLVIAQGAAVIAEMGWLPFLAKDIRIALCDDSFWALFESGQPIAAEAIKAYNEEVFTCVDQRNNRAKVIINEGIGQERGKNLDILNVPVLGDRRFGDDIFISGEIDNNIVLNVKAHSKMVNTYAVDYAREKSTTIYELCFGLDTRR